MLSGLSFRLAFAFSINSLIFSGFRLTFFAFIWSKSRQSWTEPALCTFSWHYILVCEVVQKYHEMLFLKKFFLVLILHSTCFIFITSKGKQTTEKQLHRAWEWTKSNKKSPVTFKLTRRSNVRFSQQTMQWHHYP